MRSFFQESLLDSYIIKLSSDKFRRIERAMRKFPHRAKERIPYITRHLIDDVVMRDQTVIAEKLDGALSILLNLSLESLMM
jgi:hypothetical protein